MQHLQSSLVLHVRRTGPGEERWRCIVERDRRREVGCFADEPLLTAFIDRQVGAFLDEARQDDGARPLELDL